VSRDHGFSQRLLCLPEAFDGPSQPIEVDPGKPPSRMFASDGGAHRVAGAAQGDGSVGQRGEALAVGAEPTIVGVLAVETRQGALTLVHHADRTGVTSAPEPAWRARAATRTGMSFTVEAKPRTSNP
jgi:hypothetical protein